MDNNILIEVKNVSEVPRLQDSFKTLLGDVISSIKKRQIYGFKDGEKKIFFDMME